MGPRSLIRWWRRGDTLPGLSSGRGLFLLPLMSEPDARLRESGRRAFVEDVLDAYAAGLIDGEGTITLSPAIARHAFELEFFHPSTP